MRGGGEGSRFSCQIEGRGGAVTWLHPQPHCSHRVASPGSDAKRGYCFWADGQSGSINSFCTPLDSGLRGQRSHFSCPVREFKRPSLPLWPGPRVRAEGRVLSGAPKSVCAPPCPALCSPPPQHSQLFPETRVMTCSSFCLNLCFRQAASRSSEVRIWWGGRKDVGNRG